MSRRKFYKYDKSRTFLREFVNDIINKDYAKANAYRKKIEDAGYVVLDTPQGTQYQKK